LLRVQDHHNRKDFTHCMGAFPCWLVWAAD
jgi:hypothetical protein